MKKGINNFVLIFLSTLFLFSFASADIVATKDGSTLELTSEWVLSYSTDTGFFLWFDNAKNEKTEACLLSLTATSMNELDQHKNLWNKEGGLVAQLNRKKKVVDDVNYYGFCRNLDNDDIDYIKFGEHSTVAVYNDNFFRITDDLGLPIQDVVLDYNTEQCLIDCKAEGHSILYSEGKLFDSYDFMNKYGYMVGLSNSGIFLRISQFENVSEENITISCSEAEVYNETTELFETQTACEEIFNGYINYTIESFSYEPYNMEILSAGTYYWELSGKKNPSEDIDWAVGFKDFPTQTIREYWAWWNGDWSFKQRIDIQENDGLGYANYTVGIIVPYYDGMNNNFSDLRFLDYSETVELDYWISEKVDGENATLWVETDLSAGANNTIYMYYGNELAVSLSDRESIFDNRETEEFNKQWDQTHLSQNIKFGMQVLAKSNLIVLGARVGPNCNPSTSYIYENGTNKLLEQSTFSGTSTDFFTYVEDGEQFGVHADSGGANYHTQYDHDGAFPYDYDTVFQLGGSYGVGMLVTITSVNYDAITVDVRADIEPTIYFIVEEEEEEEIVEVNSGVDLYGIISSSGAGLGLFLETLAVAFPILLFGLAFVGIIVAIGWQFYALLIYYGRGAGKIK